MLPQRCFNYFKNFSFTITIYKEKCGASKNECSKENLISIVKDTLMSLVWVYESFIFEHWYLHCTLTLLLG